MPLRDKRDTVQKKSKNISSKIKKSIVTSHLLLKYTSFD